MAPECTLPEGVRLHNTPFPIPGYEAMTVNSYSIQPPEHSGEGILIDAGSSFRSIFGDAPDNGATQWRLILTHTHSDHVIHFSELSQLVAEAHSPANEPYSDALPVRGGDAFDLGPWGLTAMETPGHSPGGMSYLLEGPSTPVAFVGDALFCYSIGKVNAHYDAALTSIREKILGLPTETILCPGHGPPTTVGFEKTHNPFFA